MSTADLIEITDKPIAPESVLSRLEWDECGALVTFIGKVRGYSGEKRVLSLEHNASTQGAEAVLRNIADRMRERWELGQTAFCYRTGPVEAGGITLAIAVAARHRQDAFVACQYAIDSFKQKVLAKETLEDG